MTETPADQDQRPHLRLDEPSHVPSRTPSEPNVVRRTEEEAHAKFDSDDRSADGGGGWSTQIF